MSGSSTASAPPFATGETATKPSTGSSVHRTGRSDGYSGVGGSSAIVTGRCYVTPVSTSTSPIERRPKKPRSALCRSSNLPTTLSWAPTSKVSSQPGTIRPTRLYGYDTEEIIGKPVKVLLPEDRQHEEVNILERIRSGERVEHYETVRRRKDGGLVEVSLSVSPIKDIEGRVVGASKIARDISERRRAEEQERLLLREMNHRIKNLFALASGVVTLSTHSAKTAPELAEMIRDRLGALSRAHALTLPEITGTGTKIERSATLSALLRTVLSPYVAAPLVSTGGMAIAGPEVLVGAKAASTFALLLHEFATNAAKYGALSLAEGTVSVEWSIEDGRLNLTWRERGGPVLAHEPDFQGFGSRLTERILEGRVSWPDFPGLGAQRPDDPPLDAGGSPHQLIRREV